MNFGAFLSGAVQGAQQGVGAGLDLDQRLYDARNRNRTEQAQQSLQQAFKMAADKGGLQNMDQSFFDNTAADIAATGDLQGATSFSTLGTQVRTSQAQLSAQRASLNLSSGNPEAAIGDLNEAFGKLGMKSMNITGITQGPDGKPAYTTSSGQTVDPAHMEEAINKIVLTPKEALAYGLDKMKAASTVGLQGAQTEEAQAKTETENVTRGPKQALIGAQTGAAGAVAGYNRTRAGAIEAKLPGELEKTSAEANLATTKAGIAEAQAPYDIELKKAQAQKTQGEADMGPTPNPDQRGQGIIAQSTTAAKDFDARYPTTDTDLPPEAHLDPSSPTLRDTTRDLATKLTNDRKVSAQGAYQLATQTVRNNSVMIMNNNPELAAHPDLAAEITATLMATPWDVQTDPQGKYVVMPLGDSGELHKVYIQKSMSQGGPQQAMPTTTGMVQ